MSDLVWTVYAAGDVVDLLTDAEIADLMRAPIHGLILDLRRCIAEII